MLFRSKRKQAPKSSFSVVCKFNASDGELACSIYKIIGLQVQALEARFLAQVKFLRIESIHASTNEKLVQFTVKKFLALGGEAHRFYP